MRNARAGCLLLLVALLLPLSSCSYFQEASRQARYAALQKEAPQQKLLKHLLGRDKFFVFGRIAGKPARKPVTGPLAVVALSDQFSANEVVDVNHFSRVGSYYGLHLPEGSYRLLVVADQDGDGFFQADEVIGGRELDLDEIDTPGKVLGGFDLDLGAPHPAPEGLALRVQAAAPVDLHDSLFFPKGTIRSLDDPIFAPEMATLGLYEPATFLEQLPMMFYSLEEDIGYKVPVVFVHGIDGSPRDFREIVARLDRTLYRPWFFYYPSGSELGQLSEFFYKIFLSGRVIPLAEMPMVIVAHSMGGLIVRDALNRHRRSPEENRVRRLVTIASPLGGHPAARNSARGPLLLPAWRDINPDSDFIRRLHRYPLPEGTEYHLLYAFGNTGAVKIGENSDGVVPLSSQLTPSAQSEASRQYGFNATHTGILQDPAAIDRVLRIVYEVPSAFSPAQLAELVKGGFQVDLGEDYTPLQQYLLRTYGVFYEALALGRLAPELAIQEQFLQVCRGEREPENDAEAAWVKFARDFPEPRRSALRSSP